MDVVLMETGVARPSLVLRGLTELAQIRSLCTWGALLLAAVAALGSLVRALRKTARWLRLHRARVAIAGGCGGRGGGMTGSIVPEPSVDFSDDDEEESDPSCSEAAWSESEESAEEAEEEDARRLGYSVGDQSETESEGEEDSEPRKRRYPEQDWGFGVGGWESWFGGGRVVRDWEQSRSDNDSKGSFSAVFSGGGGYGFAPLIRSFGLDTPSLKLGYSDGLDLRLCDSRMRSSVPAAVIAPAGIRKRALVGVKEAGNGVGGSGNKVLYVAERGGGSRAIVDLRNTKAVVSTERGSSEDTWGDADAVFVSPGY